LNREAGSSASTICRESCAVILNTQACAPWPIGPHGTVACERRADRPKVARLAAETAHLAVSMSRNGFLARSPARTVCRCPGPVYKLDRPQHGRRQARLGGPLEPGADLENRLRIDVPVICVRCGFHEAIYVRLSSSGPWRRLKRNLSRAAHWACPTCSRASARQAGQELPHPES